MYLIKADDQFWTGEGWSREYPVAKLFIHKPGQRVIDRAAKMADKAGWNGVSLDIIKNYGMQNQETFEGVPTEWKGA